MSKIAAEIKAVRAAFNRDHVSGLYYGLGLGFFIGAVLASFTTFNLNSSTWGWVMPVLPIVVVPAAWIRPTHPEDVAARKTPWTRLDVAITLAFTVFVLLVAIFWPAALLFHVR